MALINRILGERRSGLANPDPWLSTALGYTRSNTGVVVTADSAMRSTRPLRRANVLPVRSNALVPQAAASDCTLSIAPAPNITRVGRLNVKLFMVPFSSRFSL
jgi:hypothetical protein